MFSKSKEPDATINLKATAPKRESAKGGAPSIISYDLIVRGTLVSEGDIQIEGKVDGDIRANGLVIGEKAIVVGDIYAEETVIRGRVEGSIRACKVSLGMTCHVEGTVLHGALAIESGAFFEGNCRHSENPLADAPYGAERLPDAPKSGADNSSADQYIPHSPPAQKIAKTDAKPLPISPDVKK